MAKISPLLGLTITLKILKEIRAIHKDSELVASSLPDKDFAMKYIISDLSSFKSTQLRWVTDRFFH